MSKMITKFSTKKQKKFFNSTNKDKPNGKIKKKHSWSNSKTSVENQWEWP